MVLRYRYALARADKLRQAVDDMVEMVTETAPYELDGKIITKEYVRESYRLLDNLDHYIADDFPERLSGFMAEGMVARHFYKDNRLIIAHTGIEPDHIADIHAFRHNS